MLVASFSGRLRRRSRTGRDGAGQDGVYVIVPLGRDYVRDLRKTHAHAHTRRHAIWQSLGHELRHDGHAYISSATGEEKTTNEHHETRSKPPEPTFGFTLRCAAKRHAASSGSERARLPDQRQPKLRSPADEALSRRTRNATWAAHLHLCTYDSHSGLAPCRGCRGCRGG